MSGGLKQLRLRIASAERRSRFDLEAEESYKDFPQYIYSIIVYAVTEVIVQPAGYI